MERHARQPDSRGSDESEIRNSGAGLYDESIKANEEAIRLKPEWEPWAYWTMEVSYLKKRDPRMALHALEKNPEGEWWEKINQDPELESLRDGEKFQSLYAKKLIKKIV